MNVEANKIPYYNNVVLKFQINLSTLTHNYEQEVTKGLN